MSQLSSISSHEEDFDSGQSDYAPSSSTASHSQCSSSTFTLTVAAPQPAQNREASATTTLGSGWTDSKHSSYLDFMEANFVQSMFGSSHWSKDVNGMIYEYQQSDSSEEYDKDSAQSRLRIPHENMEFKMFDHCHRTWKPCGRPVLSTGIPLVLLANNPWVKHFRSKKTSTVTSTLLNSRKDMEASPAAMKEIGRAEQLPRISALNDASGRNPGIENGDSQACERKPWIQKTILDRTVDAHISSSKRRALWSTYNQVLATRRKINDDARNCGQAGTNNQDGASSPSLTKDLENL